MEKKSVSGFVQASRDKIDEIRMLWPTCVSQTTPQIDNIICI